MKDEINKIIQSISDFYKLDNALKYYLDRYKAQTLLDYITNLQQEIEKLNDDKRGMLVQLYKANDNRDKVKQENERLKENNSDMQEEMARTWQKCDDLQQENERLKKENNNKAMNDYAHAIDESWYRELYDDYKSRCEKASDNLKRNYWINEHEHNDDVVNMTLNILQNGSDRK